MKTFRFIFIILMIVSFAGVMAGAAHQFVIFLISGICYVVFDNEIKKEQKTNKPYSRTFNADNL
jgi:hypothetical protein